MSPEKRLGSIFEAVQKEYVAQETPTRATNLRLSMLRNPKEPHKSMAQLDLKASETKWFLQAFAPVLQNLVSLEKEHEATMLQAMEDMAKLSDLFDQGDVFLTNGEWLKAVKLGESFLKKYLSLCLGP